MEKKLILVVDDEASFREIFSAKLSALGYRVAVAEDGISAIGKAKELKPDLILMDVRMPGMDGVATMFKMKEDPDLKNLKVLFLTTLGDNHSNGEQINDRFAKESGAVGYLKKTDDLDDLIKTIVSYLQ